MKHLTPDSSASVTGVGTWASSGVLCSLLFPAWTSRVPLGEGPTGRWPVVLGRSALHPSQGTPSWCGKLLFWTDFGSSCTKSPSSQASRGCQPQGWGWVGVVVCTSSPSSAPRLQRRRACCAGSEGVSGTSQECHCPGACTPGPCGSRFLLRASLLTLAPSEPG